LRRCVLLSSTAFIDEGSFVQPATLYRVFSNRDYAEQFIEGNIRFSTLRYYNSIKDDIRVDRTEGYGRLKRDGKKLIFNPQDNTLMTTHGRENLHVDGGEKGTFICCFSSPESGRLQELPTKFGRFVVRIKEPEQLFKDVQNSIHHDPKLSEFKFELSSSMVRYDKEMYQKSITEEETDSLGWAQKPQAYSDEMEYRYRFGFFYPELIGLSDSYTVKIDKKLDYCDLVKRMKFE